MGKRYVVSGGQSVAASGTETQLVVTAPSNRLVRVHRVRVSQVTHNTSEQLSLAAKRASAAGSGGSAKTAEPLEANQGATATTVTSGPTSEPTYTGAELLDAAWNTLSGRDVYLPPGSEIAVPPSGILGFYVVAPSGATTVTPVVELELSEEG